MDAPIFITGIPRSGTSMTAGIVFLSGAFGGAMLPGTKKSKHTPFENPLIKDDLISRFFFLLKSDPNGWKDFPLGTKHVSDALVNHFKATLDFMIKNDGYSSGPWFVKDTRLCLIWPIVNRVYPDAKWIVVRRDIKDIVNSCMNTTYMTAYSTKSQWSEWALFYQNKLMEIKENTNAYEVWPHKFVEWDLDEIRGCIIEFLGLEWKEQPILKFITPALLSQYKRSQKCQG